MAADDGQTTAQLLAMDEEYRIDSLVVAFAEAIGRKTTISPEERLVLVIEAMESQVNNGGFWQFFLNTPEYALELPSALRAINCPQTAKLAEQALGQLRKTASPEAIHQEAEARSDELRTTLDDLDQLYFTRDEEIEDLLFDYIRRNAAHIIVP